MSTIEKVMQRQYADSPVHDKEPAETPCGPSNQAERGRTTHHVDLAELEKKGCLIPELGNHRLAEEYRMIKRPILKNAFGNTAAHIEHSNLIMVVSALSGEGKTFTTLNLSMSMAQERDTTVLLVDSDVIRPSLTQLFNLQDYPDLTDLLQDTSLSLGDVIINTDIPKLRILPAGRVNVYSTELLASKRMGQVAAELSSTYHDRIVLFDSPPLLITSQASVLAYPMGQILLVVEAGSTSQGAVKEALSMLDSNKVIGMVLNKTPRVLFGTKYSGYGYGYGHERAGKAGGPS